MTSYKITFTGDNLYTRHEDEPAVFPRDAVEGRGGTYVNGKLTIPATEPKPAVLYKAATYRYTPSLVEFEYENNDGLESGAEVVKAWLGADGIDSLSDMLGNIRVEKESKSYSVSYTKRFGAEVTAEQAEQYELEDTYAVEQWLDNEGDGELEYPEDTGEMSDIEVVGTTHDHVDVEWN